MLLQEPWPALFEDASQLEFLVTTCYPFLWSLCWEETWEMMLVLEELWEFDVFWSAHIITLNLIGILPEVALDSGRGALLDYFWGAAEISALCCRLRNAFSFEMQNAYSRPSVLMSSLLSPPPICWAAYITWRVLLSSCSLAVLQLVKVFPVLWKRGVECWCSPVLTLSSKEKKKKLELVGFSAWSILCLHAGKQSGVGKLQKACWLDLGQLLGGRQ